MDGQIIQEAECEKLRMNIRYQANTEIADAERNFNMQKAVFETQVNQQKAEAELAYELQVTKATFIDINGCP